MLVATPQEVALLASVLLHPGSLWLLSPGVLHHQADPIDSLRSGFGRARLILRPRERATWAFFGEHLRRVPELHVSPMERS